MPIDQNAFKEALRGWASGVTVVTSRAGDKMHGMTVSAFSSVSADPPLVLVCANRASTTHAVIEEGGVFAVNILAEHQQDVSNLFASSKYEDSRLDRVSWTAGETGAPLIDGALASLECRVSSAHREGSHTIYIGQVESVHTSDAEPLLYYDGGYRALICKD
jgi:flavin reductase (DIM6/NTAB) family NADH-FMN oxidoreductase RutF